jgi:spoIIIJ-associated protein
MNDRHQSGRRPPQRTTARPPAPKLDCEGAARELQIFIEQAMREMHLALEWEISAQGATQEGQPSIVVSFRGEDEALLLERNAELLLTLEYIAHRWLRLDPRLHDLVRFDCGDYRAERLDELKLSARVAAQRVRETGEVFRFNPMSSRERRLIHLELANANDVRTMSEGSGDRRQLVIYPTTKYPATKKSSDNPRH